VLLTELVSKESLDKLFHGQKDRVGPAFVLEARIYGKDITYPLPPALIAAASHVLQGAMELAWGVVAVQSRHQQSVAATIEGVNTGTTASPLLVSATCMRRDQFGPHYIFCPPLHCPK
jgi:hypothetical protein